MSFYDLSALTKAINQKLVIAMGAASRVWHGMAEDKAARPYAVFRLMASGPAEYHGTGGNSNVSYPVPVTVEIFCDTDYDAGHYLLLAEQQLNLLDAVDDGVIHSVNLVSKGPIEQEPERDTDGKIVWRADLIVEVLFGR